MATKPPFEQPLWVMGPYESIERECFTEFSLPLDSLFTGRREVIRLCHGIEDVLLLQQLCGLWNRCHGYAYPRMKAKLMGASLVLVCKSAEPINWRHLSTSTALRTYNKLLPLRSS